MATNYGDTVNAFYLAYYGRPADPAGLAFWTQALQKNNGDFSTIINTFSSSQEATARFSSKSVSDRVSDIYQQLFNRAPDKAGLDYWASTIASGKLSVADAAISIMQGAQNADAQISSARGQAAAQFTSAVAASGVAYDGDAAIQAARLVISAVNANTKPSDITALVSAGTSLVQTAHDSPSVIKALANGGDLGTLLSTAAGTADPVGMVQALATLGKAAQTDSAGLNNLLQGGGVTGLLNSLPSGTTLTDVASAVKDGGLGAGVDVVQPPAAAEPPPPPITPTIAFVGTDGKDLPANTTLVANSIWYFVDVHGVPSGGSADFQVSKTGNANDWTTVREDQTLADGSYFIRYVAKDGAGNSGASNALKLIMDHTVAYPNVVLAQDTGTLATDFITSNGAVKISGLHANETWTYSFDGTNWTAGTSDSTGSATIAAPGTDGAKTLQIRTLENVNGNSQFTSTAFRYTLDTVAPAQGLKLASVQGAAAGSTHTDLAKADIVFSYTGTLDLNKAEALFYRINSNDWSRADATNIDAVNKTITFKGVDLSHGDAHIYLESKDAAGNVLDLNVTVSGPPDTTAPAAPTVALDQDTGASATDGITSNGMYKIAGVEYGGSWEYSTDGTTWHKGAQAAADGTATGFLSSGEQALQIRTYDAAGNVSASTTLHATYDNSAPAQGLVFDHISGEAQGVTTTTQTKVDAVFTYTGAIASGDTVEYTSDGSTWTKVDSTMINADAKTITFHDIDLSGADKWIQIRTSDLAGNSTESKWLDIDGPYTKYTVGQANDAGFSVNSDQAAHIYLTNGGTSVQIHSSDATGDAVQYQTVTIGVQATSVQGVLGVGPSAAVHTDTTGTYGLGTSGNDTLAGQNVWGYGGDDTITATGSVTYNSAIIYGGAGSDVIYTESSSSQIMFANAQESSVVADDTAAHGFDTVYVSNSTSTKFTEVLNFEDVKFGGGDYRLTGTAYTGAETGNALLTLLNGAVAGSFQAGAGTQSAIIDFGTPGSASDVNFLVIDTDGDGKITAGDYVVKIVGAVDPTGGPDGTSWTFDHGMVFIHNATVS